MSGSGYSQPGELGTITICQDCGFAIRLERFTSEVIGDYNSWEHFRVPITPHVGRPVRCWSDYDFYGNPT
jgi:hypothetical protein